jgi:UDP-glucose 4-epimerase
MMKVLVLGGAGFIGRHVCDLLMQRGHVVTAFDPAPLELPAPHAGVRGDVRDATAVQCYVAQHDAVVHLAGILGTAETVDRPGPAIEVNILGALNVFEAVRREGKLAVTITVGNHWMLNSYSITKSCAERLALMYDREHGTRIAVVRGLNAYGPGQKAKPVRKVIPNFILPALRGQDLTIYGDGEQIMDFIYVRDLASILLTALFRDHGCYDRIFEAGSGRRTTINEVAECVIQAAGSRSRICHHPMRPGEIANSVVLADTETLRPLGVDVAGMVSLEDGLRQTIPWYREHLADL